MPGLFGAASHRREVQEGLISQFSTPWKGCESVTFAEGVLGGHAFPPGRALHGLAASQHLVVDGERAIYSSAARFARQGSGELYRWNGDVPIPTPICKGNVAFADIERGLWLLVTEWSGAFPLYYVHKSGEFLFCSRIGPLARVTGAERDPVGMAQFLRSADGQAGRTPFRGIRRVHAGQALVYNQNTDQLRVCETSRVWVPEGSSFSNLAQAADAAWKCLEAAVEQSVARGTKTAVMTSGGWDSRTLLGAMRQRPDVSKLTCYVHGDLNSRELELVERVVHQLGLPLHREPIDDHAFDLDALQHSFACTENVVFPHWHRAGVVLAKVGVECVTAGVFGEVMGGHYGPAMLLQGMRKIAAVGSGLMGWSSADSGSAENGIPAVQNLFRIQSAAKPWYLSSDFWSSAPDLVNAINADMEADVQRLARRAGSLDQLIEAFVTEHRGSQYIAAQILSCRSSLDIAIPFADQEALLLASRVPTSLKIHNSLNQEMLRLHQPELLKIGLASTLVPASAPLFVQEVSRLIRRTWEDGRWWLHSRLPTWVERPRLGWVDFEFLRSGKALNQLAEDLRCDFWDRPAIRALIADVVSGKWKQPAHPVSDMMMKIYTLDLMLRVRSKG